MDNAIEAIEYTNLLFIKYGLEWLTIGAPKNLWQIYTHTHTHSHAQLNAYKGNGNQFRIS